MKAQAHSAATAFGAPGTVRPADAARKAEAAYPDRALPAADRIRAGLRGAVIAVAAIAISALVAVLIVAAVFQSGASS